jgi:hypothetical protein
VVELFWEGELARIIPVQEDEPHVAALRQVNQAAEGVLSKLPFAYCFKLREVADSTLFILR